MIRLCKNLFYKPKYGSDADSIMLKHLFSTVTVVLVCLAAISLSAYAFFSYSVTSGTNTIQSSSFSTTVTIQGSDEAVITQGDIQRYRFKVPGAYTVTITADSGTTGTGYCIVTVNDTPYYTQQLGKDLNAPGGERNEISFVLEVQTSATVNFASRWGTTSYYNSATKSEFYIKNADSLTVTGGNTSENISNTPDETKPVETKPEETTTPTEPVKTVHTVTSGESLAQIAQAYNISYQRIAAYNSIENPRLIRPGQKIQIPPEDWVETTIPTEVTE